MELGRPYRCPVWKYTWLRPCKDQFPNEASNYPKTIFSLFYVISDHKSSACFDFTADCQTTTFLFFVVFNLNILGDREVGYPAWGLSLNMQGEQWLKPSAHFGSRFVVVFAFLLFFLRRADRNFMWRPNWVKWVLIKFATFVFCKPLTQNENPRSQLCFLNRIKKLF